MVVKSNGNVIYFDNWGSGDIDFSYTIQATDPEGVWTVDYCGLWSDFEPNKGWVLKVNQTDFTFIVDTSPPSVTINSPRDGSAHNSDFLVNATATDTWSGISSVVYRWENETGNGEWVEMTRTQGTDFFTANFDVSGLADGTYTIRVRANDTVGHEGEDVVSITIDATPPSITITSPSSNTWYNSDFSVVASVTDQHGVSSVNYRWENSTSVGPWVPMSRQDSIWSSLFDITSVKDGIYTFRVKANDTLGNENNETIRNVGIDDEPPSSKVLPLPEYTTDTKFNISWEGRDNESGLDCYVVQYRYNDTQTLSAWYNLSVEGETCTNKTEVEFDAEEVTGTNPNKYTFYFRSLAKDKAGNWEVKTAEDTKTTIFIPVLTDVYAVDSVTGFVIPYGGKTSANRIIYIVATNKTPDVGPLNFTLTFYNHTPGSDPKTGGMTTDTKNIAYIINLSAGPYQSKTQISYWVYAETIDGSQDERNPPTGYWYFTMYDHPLANFVITGTFHARLGRSDLIGVEVRNIQTRFDRIYLELDSEYAKFVETSNQTLVVELNPQEERTVYVRLYPSGLEGYTLNLHATSLLADPTLEDSDSLRIVIFMPAEFPGLTSLGIFILIFLSLVIYLKFVTREEIN